MITRGSASTSLFDGRVSSFSSLRMRGIVTLAGIAGVLVPLPGCQSVTGSPSQSQVRLIDTSPDAGGVDAYLTSSVLAYNLGLGTITSYVPITPGTYSISTDAAGTRTVLAAAGGTFATNNQYTVLFGDSASGYQETILKDQTQAAPSGQISLRVLDQADRAGAVDLYLVPTGSTVTSINPFQTNVTFGKNTGYFNVPAGTYTLVALPTGTVPTATGTTSYTGASVVYGSGSARTLILLDQQLITTPGLQVITASDYDSVSATS